MNFRNIDIPVDLAKKAVKCKNFIELVVSYRRIAPRDSKIHQIETQPAGIAPIQYTLHPWMIPANQLFADSVASMLHTIPFYFTIPKSDDGDFLGAYYSGKGTSAPYIELYLTRIDKACANIDEFKFLFTKVILHELMHAVMDIYNQAQYYDSMGKYIGPTEKILYSSQYGKWREESFANAGALKLIRDYVIKQNQDIMAQLASCVGFVYNINEPPINKPKNIFWKFFEYSETYMNSQPPEYALGVHFVDEEINFYDRIIEKVNGVDTQVQQDWLNEAKSGNHFDDIFKTFEKRILNK